MTATVCAMCLCLHDSQADCGKPVTVFNYTAEDRAEDLALARWCSRCSELEAEVERLEALADERLRLMREWFEAWDEFVTFSPSSRHDAAVKAIREHIEAHK